MTSRIDGTKQTMSSSSLSWILGQFVLNLFRSGYVGQTVGRHPMYMWLGVLPACLVMLCGGWAIEAWLSLLPLWIHPSLGWLLASCTSTAALVVPQQRWVRLPPWYLTLCIVNVIWHLQITTLVCSLVLPRPLLLVLAALPNLCLAVYATALLLLPSGTGTLRPACWNLYTIYAPVVILPQTALAILWCTLSLGASECLTTQLFRIQ